MPELRADAGDVDLRRREHRHLFVGVVLSRPARRLALVSLEKLGAWYLLMIISFVLVSLVNRAPHASGGAARSDGSIA